MAVTTFDPSYQKTPYTYKRQGSCIFLEAELCPIEVLHFLPFCSCDLHLDPMTFIYELDPYSMEIHQMCKYELPTSRLAKVIVWHTYIHIHRDRQTDTTEIVYHAASWVVKKEGKKKGKEGVCFPTWFGVKRLGHSIAAVIKRHALADRSIAAQLQRYCMHTGTLTPAI